MNSELYETGLRIRKDVLGAEYVDRAIENATDFNRHFKLLFSTASVLVNIWMTQLSGCHSSSTSTGSSGKSARIGRLSPGDSSRSISPDVNGPAGL